MHYRLMVNVGMAPRLHVEIVVVCCPSYRVSGLQLEVKMKGCDKEDEYIYSKWIQCNSGGMLPAVGSDKATAAEGGIAPDVMFICHTAGGRGI